MADKIKLVQGDTRPQLVFSVTDEKTGAPADLGGADAIVMKFRETGADTLKATIVCAKLTGMVMPDGTINNDPPYHIPGAGGRVFLDWPAGTLDTAGEFEGELEITFSDGTTQTVYEVIHFRVREQF